MSTYHCIHFVCIILAKQEIIEMTHYATEKITKMWTASYDKKVKTASRDGLTMQSNAKALRVCDRDNGRGRKESKRDREMETLCKNKMLISFVIKLNIDSEICALNQRHHQQRLHQLWWPTVIALVGVIA